MAFSIAIYLICRCIYSTLVQDESIYIYHTPQISPCRLNQYLYPIRHKYHHAEANSIYFYTINIDMPSAISITMQKPDHHIYIPYSHQYTMQKTLADAYTARNSWLHYFLYTIHRHHVHHTAMSTM
jgi:hypothetical protein